MANSKATILDFLFSRGVRQDQEKDLLAAPALIKANNVEFDKPGRLVHRDGFVNVGTSTFSKTDAYTGNVRRLLTGPKGENIACTDDNIYVHLSGADKVLEAGTDRMRNNIVASLHDTYYSGSDTTGTVPHSECCVIGSGSYLVISWQQIQPTTGLQAIYADVIELATGARAWSAQVVQTGVSANYGHRMLAFGNEALIIYATASGSYEWRKLSVAGGALAFTGLPASLASANDGDGVNLAFDIAACDSGASVVIAYRATGPTVRLRKYTESTMALAASANFGTNSGQPLDPTAISVCSGPGPTDPIMVICNTTALTDVWMGAYTQALAFSVASNENNATFSSTGAVPQQVSIDQISSTLWLIQVSNIEAGSPSSSFNKPVGHLWWTKATSVFVRPAFTAFANYCIGTRALRNTLNSDEVYSFGRFSANGQTHLMLLDWGKAANIAAPKPVMILGDGVTPQITSLTASGCRPFAVCQGTTADRFFLTASRNVTGSVLSGNGITTFSFEARDSKRYLSTALSQAVLFGGASPLTWDGGRIVELGFFSNPGVGPPTPVASGGQVEQGVYQYCFVYEWTDLFGNRHQSSPSLSVVADLSSGTYAGNANRVTLSLPVLHATRKQYLSGPGGDSDIGCPVRIVGYRTNKSGEPPFFRLSSVRVNATTAASEIPLNDTQADASLGEILYTSSGVLPNSAPPASLFLTTFGSRVWGICSEDPETIWCTKTFISGEAPMYSTALRIPIPGSGRIHALLPQDGKLYALAENGIWIASYGDGPDNLGGGSGFPQPVFLTGTANCTDPRGAVETQDGLFFVGRDKWGTGIYWMRRGEQTPVSIGMRVRDELAACPVVKGVVDRVLKNRVELLMADTERDPTQSRILYYHYDMVDEEQVGAFTVAPFGPLECLGVWLETTVGGLSNAGDIMLQSSTLGVDDANAHLSYDAHVTIETGDIRPFGPLGFGEVQSVTLLATFGAAAGLSMEASFDSGQSYSEQAQWLASSFTSVDGDPIVRRWESPTKKLPRGAVRYRFTDSNSEEGGPLTRGLIWHGFTLELSPLGGTLREADSERR